MNVKYVERRSPTPPNHFIDRSKNPMNDLNSRDVNGVNTRGIKPTEAQEKAILKYRKELQDDFEQQLKKRLKSCIIPDLRHLYPKDHHDFVPKYEQKGGQKKVQGDLTAKRSSKTLEFKGREYWDINPEKYFRKHQEGDHGH